VDVWVRDIGRNAQSRLTFEPTDDSTPVWFPSGQRLAYSEVGATTSIRIFVSNADGSGGRRELMKGLSPAVSHDGRHIIYLVEERGAMRLRYSALDASGTAGPAERLFKSDSEPNVVPPVRVSPDGSFLAYTERQPSGDYEVFVTRFPSGEGRWQISTGG
jgi:Tol biopolymer transport system component